MLAARQPPTPGQTDHPDHPFLYRKGRPAGRLSWRTDRAVGARSEWSPGVLAGVFSGAAVRDCPALTERDLNAVTERDVRAGCGLLVVERVADRVPCTLGAFCAC